jgi:glutamine amidotransferase
MIVIVKYNAGNTKSVQNALLSLGYDSVITDDKELIMNAEKVIFPGVGEASSAMEYLREKNLDVLIKSLKQPVLGICLGLQLMCKSSEEGETNCLDIFPIDVLKFEETAIVPHMGWNDVDKLSGALFKAIPNQSDLYFVHSYYAPVCEYTIGTCSYINPFSAALNKNNFYATQFHPEKSSEIGLKILQNFLEL